MTQLNELSIDIKYLNKPPVVSSPFQCVFFPSIKGSYIIMLGHHWGLV